MSSARKGVLVALEKRARANDQVASCLIEDPHCLDGNPVKDKAYSIAFDYFTEKIVESEAAENASYHCRTTIELVNLIDSYNECNKENKDEYARKIAYYVLQTQENWLKIIPDEIKEAAFQVIAEYLEKQKGS